MIMAGRMSLRFADLSRGRRALARAEQGAALIEFTLVFPVLIFLLLGVVEFSEAFAVSRKLSNAAATVADLVSQEAKVTDADLDDISKVADALVAPFGPDKLGLVVTSVVADNTNNTSVSWSYAHGRGATRRTDIALPRGLTEAKSSVIVAETSYQFTPTIGFFLTGVITLNGKAFFHPRVTSLIAKDD
jgi:Flp pilus assembly protein TadG